MEGRNDERKNTMTRNIEKRYKRNEKITER